MTVYALRLQNGTDTAARSRFADLLGLIPNGNLGARSGIRPGPTSANVAVVAGTMKVSVQPFVAWIDGAVSDAQGGYPFVCDAALELTLANGHATLSRTDVVAAVVRDDPYDSTGQLTATVEVVQGSPGGGVPGLPANALPLRNVVVPAGASTGTGGLASGALSTDRRTYTTGLGGVLNVSGQAERDALTATPGMHVYRADTDLVEVRRASSWQPLSVGATQAGKAAVTLPAVQAYSSTVTFPQPFAAVPIVTLTPDDWRFTCSASGVTATGFTLTTYYIPGTPGAGFILNVNWHARSTT